MQLIDLERKLEQIQFNLCGTYEITNAITTSLDSGMLGANHVSYALNRVVCDMENATKELEELIKETIKIRVYFEKVK